VAEGGKIGLAAAVEVLGPGEAPRGEGEQLMLAGLPLGEVGRGEAAAPAIEAERKGGRPPGARNRRTMEWVEYMGGRYRSPLIVLAEIYSRPVDALAMELGCTRYEAFQLQLRAAEQLAPYLHQKLPLAVEFEGKGLVALTVQTLPELLRLTGGAEVEDGVERVFEGVVVNDDKSTS